MTRVYSIRNRLGYETIVLRWGLSRYGDNHDPEMEAAVGAFRAIGDGTGFYVSFTPDKAPRMKTPEQVQAQRIRNMQRRAAKLPLFTAEIESRQITKDYFSIEHAEQSQRDRSCVHRKFAEEFWQKHAPELEVRLPNQALDLSAENRARSV